MFKKWILPIGALLILFIAGSCYFTFRTLNDLGDSAEATYPVSAERLYAELATPDSIAKWIGPSTVLTHSGSGAMQPGDTVRLATTPVPGGPPSQSIITGWVVRDAAPGRLLVRDLYDSLQHKSPIAVRRDSFVAVGDSTKLITTFVASPFTDSASTKMRDSSPVMGTMAGKLFSMMRGLLTAGATEELRLLQKRLGGTIPAQGKSP